MSYLVLARKWRPTRFDDVVGQSHITQTLRNAIEKQRIPHALLFIGSRGVGKTSCARILAKALNCQSSSQPTPTPCEQCESCISINQGNSVDVFEIDGASNNGVEQVREIRDSAQFMPSVSRKKIYIIDEVHMLSITAFNALLKTLEEPPAHVGFIFATTEPHKIPDTIISRCQRFDFKRITDRDIVGALKKITHAEGVNAEEEALEHIAREAQGGMRDSLSLLDQMISFCGTSITSNDTRKILGLTPRQSLASLLHALVNEEGGQVLELINQHVEEGGDLKRFLNEFLSFMRDLMVIKVCPEPEKILILPPSELKLLISVAHSLQVGQIHRLFKTMMESADEILRSPFPRLIIEMVLLQMCHQGPTASISEVLKGLTKLETELAKGEISVHFSQAQHEAIHVAHNPSEHHLKTHPSEPSLPPKPSNSVVPSSNSIPSSQSSPNSSPPQFTGRSSTSTPIDPPLHSPPPRQIENSPSLSAAPPNHKKMTPIEQPTHTESALNVESTPVSHIRPQHPPFEYPLEDPLHYGEGVTLEIYQKLHQVNQRFDKIDQFMGSQFRLKSIPIAYMDNELKLSLPSDLYNGLEQYRVHVETALNYFFASPLSWKIIEHTPESSPPYASLATYLKWSRSMHMQSLIDQAIKHPTITQGVELFKGQICYVDPTEASSSSKRV